MHREIIKIINNSWGPISLRDSNYIDFTGYDVVKNLILNDPYDFSKQMVSAVQNDKLLVFAAGNAGHTTPWFSFTTANFLPETAHNIIMVTAQKNDNWTRNADGSLTSTAVMTYFSDLAKYAEDYTLAAPGQNIWSVDSNYASSGTVDIALSGTSMSAPFVTGVGALVQQAFPYLSAKQLGDVLLSTANSRITTDKLLTLQSDAQAGINKDQFNFFYINDALTRSQSELKDDVVAYLLNSEKNVSVDRIRAIVDSYSAAGSLTAYYNVPLEALVGQGIVDAGAVVKGPGALNVRRLTSSDISGDYTVAGVQNRQALYTVNTAGYNSCWSNDIKEIKSDYIAADSSETDLRQRWLYYDTNWLSYTGMDRDTAKAVTAAYMADFNAQVDQSGLRNLHAGLYKTGEGILRLTGTNTYQGSSITAAGTLAIDGSVAGDAYSLPGATLAGTGTINGNVYNQGTLQPGSYAITSIYDTAPAFSLGTMMIKGNLNSSGTLKIAVNGTDNSKLTVSGTSMLTGTTLALDGSLTYPVVNHSYNYLFSQGGITGNVTPAELSPYITLKASVNGTNAYFTAANTTPLGTLPGMSASEGSVGKAISSRLATAAAADPTSANSQTLNDLFYQDEASSRTTMKQITSSDRAQLLTVSPLTAMTTGAVHDRLDTALFDGNVNVTVPTASFDGVPGTMQVAAPVTLDTENNLWFKLLRGFEAYGGIDGGYDLYNKSFGGVIGYDKAVNDTTRVGGLFSYAKTDYNTDVMSGDSHDWRIGLYGSHDNGTWKTQGLLSYGQNRYDFNRYISYDGSKLSSDYTAKVFDMDVRTKYLPQNNRAKSWQVAPYIGLSYTHTSQGSYEESGGLFAQSMDSASNNSWRAEGGVEWKHAMDKTSSWGGSVGYKRVLSGANPELNGTFVGDDNRFTLKSDNDKDYFTYSMNISKNTGHDWTVQGEIRGEKSAHNHSEVYSLMAKHAF